MQGPGRNGSGALPGDDSSTESDVEERSWSMPLDPASPLGKPDCLLEDSAREQDQLMMLGHGAGPAAYSDDAHRCPAKVGDFQAYAAGGHDNFGPQPPRRFAYGIPSGIP